MSTHTARWEHGMHIDSTLKTTDVAARRAPPRTTREVLA
jgi:hypothetical protein